MQRLLPFVLYAISLSAAAQRYEGRGHNLQLKRVSASYAYFDVDDFGCYPTDLPPF